jgi:hypothetical protein
MVEPPWLIIHGEEFLAIGCGDVNPLGYLAVCSIRLAPRQYRSRLRQRRDTRGDPDGRHPAATSRK